MRPKATLRRLPLRLPCTNSFLRRLTTEMVVSVRNFARGGEVVKEALRRALDVAARQYSLVTRVQAIEAGLAPRTIDRLLSSGKWERVHRSVYRLAGSQRTWEQRALAVVLAAGEHAAVSHRSAPYLYGVDGFGPTGRIDVTTPRHQRRRKIVGAQVHETLDVELMATQLRWGIPVTGPARTVLDVCAGVDDDLIALGALDEMLRRRLVTWEELWECLVLHARRGRNGVARFRRILVKRWGKRGPRGVFVRTVQALLTDAGLPEPVPEHPVKAGQGRYRLDPCPFLRRLTTEFVA